MPNRAQHLQRAEENEQLARSLDLDRSAQVDWFVVMLFYAALHYMDAYLAGKDLHPSDHKARDTEIENNGSLSPIYNDYRRLKDKSEYARYEIANFHKNHLLPIENRLKRVKDHVMDLI